MRKNEEQRGTQRGKRGTKRNNEGRREKNETNGKITKCFKRTNKDKQGQARTKKGTNKGVRSEDSEGTTNRACNTGRDDKRGQQVQNMDDAHTLFSVNDADGCREMKCHQVS